MSVQKGIFTLSLDTELGWGAILSGKWRSLEARGVYVRLRSVLDDLLYQLDRLNLPCTWAIVGGMTIEDLSDLEFPSKNYSFLPTIHKALEKGEPSTFKGADIVDRILGARSSHELAWHTHLHVPFNNIHVDEDYIFYDQNQARKVESRLGAKFTSLVFPQNRSGYHRQLASLGIKCVREKKPDPHVPLSVDRMVSFFKYFAPPSACQIICSEYELIKTTGLFFSHIGLAKYGCLTPVLRHWRSWVTTLGIRNITSRGEHFHLYLHPFTLAQIPEFYRLVIQVLEKVAQQRDKSELDVLTMNQLQAA